jgi:hypothetical protein
MKPLLLLLATATLAHAELSVKVDEPTAVGTKAIVKLTMRNTGTNLVQSARAAVFLMDANGKVVGQKAEWVIGGTKDKPGLAADGSTVYHLLVPADKPFKTSKLIFTRIVLGDGQVIPAGQGYTLEK